MPSIVVNLLKVAVVGVIYLFLWFVARAVRSQVIAPSTQTKQGRSPVADIPVLIGMSPDPMAGRRMEVRRTLVIGRSDAADVAIDDGFASERHARFENVDGILFVDDLGSTNGTFVNGERIGERTQLAQGDTVRVGGTIMEAR